MIKGLLLNYELIPLDLLLELNSVTTNTLSINNTEGIEDKYNRLILLEESSG